MKSLLVLLLLIPTVSGQLLSPEEYGDNQCELIAKEYQKKYGGSLIWIQPLKPNGAYDLGEFKAHIINKVGNNYIDYQYKTVTTNLNDMVWYPYEAWDLSKSRPSFSIYWHY